CCGKFGALENNVLESTISWLFSDLCRTTRRAAPVRADTARLFSSKLAHYSDWTQTRRRRIIACVGDNSIRDKHMSPLRNYFRNIYDNVTSLAIGMKITLKYCFQKTVVVQYPEHRLSLAPRYRGIHEFENDKCIACDQCAKACPVDCIYIDKTAPRKIDKKTGTVNMSDP